jgi:hypothetical protein
MEQKIRKTAIKRYVKGESPKSIYTALKRSKNWFFKWLKRYKNGEPEWYKDKSKAPINCPTAISRVERQRTSAALFIFRAIIGYRSIEIWMGSISIPKKISQIFFFKSHRKLFPERPKTKSNFASSPLGGSFSRLLHLKRNWITSSPCFLLGLPFVSLKIIISIK